MREIIIYKNHLIQVEPACEYVWMPIRYCLSIDGQDQFKMSAKCSNRRLLKFISPKQAFNAAKRLIDNPDTLSGTAIPMIETK